MGGFFLPWILQNLFRYICEANQIQTNMPKIGTLKLLGRLIFLSVFVFVFTNANAQNNVDSLKQVIKSPVHDTTKLKAIGYLLNNLPNSAKDYDFYNEMFRRTALHALQSKNLHPFVKEHCYDALAVYHVNKAFQFMQTDYLRTIKYLNMSLRYYDPKYFVRKKYAWGGRGNVLICLGVMYNKIGNTQQAINNYFEALRILEKRKDDSSTSYAYQSIANLYKEQNKYKQALEYYVKAYDIYYKSDKLSYQDNIQKALLFVNIGKCHQELRQCELAGAYLNKGLEVAERLDDKDLLSELYFNLGKNADQCNGNIGKALADYQKSLSYSLLPENNANAHIAIGHVLLMQKKYADAERNLRTGLDVARKINHLEFQKQALEHLSVLYKQQKQFEKALEATQEFTVVKDSIKKFENDNTLTKKQLQYEYDAKQSKMQLEQERKLSAVKLENQKEAAFKNNLLIGLSGALLLLFAIGYFQYRNSKQKQAIAQFEKKSLSQKLLLSQMNPHFIFNSIDNIQSLIHNKQENEAVKYLTKFSSLTRQILENSNENYISLTEELAMIDNYLVIQQLLYNNNFDFKVNVEDDLDTDLILLPPMLTQPFIENAIKHGLKSKENGFISVSFTFTDQKLVFEVIDNGVGFKNENTGSKKSMAMRITKERLAWMSNESDFKVHIESRMDDADTVVGARVFFEIPYIYEK